MYHILKKCKGNHNNTFQDEISCRNFKIKKIFNHGVQASQNLLMFEDELDIKSLQIFCEPHELQVKEKEAEKQFQEVLSNIISERQLPQYLYKLLQDQKVETCAILEQYDKIILQLTEDLNEADKVYRQRNEKQCLQRELLQKRIEDIILELCQIGEEEITAVRKAIVHHTSNISDEFWKVQQNAIDDTSVDKPFDPYLWKPTSEILSFEDLRQTFLTNQDEIFMKRKNSLSEVCKLRNELEKIKLHSLLEKQRMEKECFEMKRDHQRNAILLRKLKQKYANLTNRKINLLSEIKQMNNEINSLQESLESSQKAVNVQQQNKTSYSIQ